MPLKSEQPIRPPGVVLGDRALESFSKDVRSAVLGLRDRGSQEEGPRYHAGPYCPLTPMYLRKESGQWKVQWRPGYLYELYPVSPGTGPITEHEIYIGATALSAATAPDLNIDLADFIYLHFETDGQGEIKELSAGISAEIVALGSAQASTFNVLPDGNDSGATDGDFYVLLAQVETVDGLASISRAGWRGNFWWKAGWNALENVGSGEKIYKDYYAPTDKKRLRSLIERASDHQINISQVGTDEIRIEGNGNDVTIEFSDGYSVKGTLVFKDGLLTSPTTNTTITL